MSLQGTFETLAPPELLELLAHAGKTGAVWMEGGPVVARVWLAEGRCCGAEAGEATGPVESPDALSARLVDVCFAVGRQDTGTFRFADAEEPPWRVSFDVDVSDAVEAVGSLLEDWQGLRAVIPSLELFPRLRPELGRDSITLDAEQWRLAVSLDGCHRVSDLTRRSGRDLLEVCHALEDLIERGAVELGPEPVVAFLPGDHRVSPTAPYGPGVDPDDDEQTEYPDDPGGPEEKPEAAVRAETAEEPEPGRDRGAVLRLFSALRDS